MASASTAPGFLDEGEVLQRYAGVTGRDVTGLDFHLALASFKLMVILETVYFRHRQGWTVGSGFERVGEAAAPLIETGLAALR